MTAWLCSLFSLVQFKMVSMCLEKPVQFKMVSMRSEKPVQFSSRWYSCTQKSLFSSVQDGIHALRKACSFELKMVSMCSEKPVQVKMVSMRSEKPVQFSSRWYPCAQKSMFNSVQFKMVFMHSEKPVQFKMVSMCSEKPVQFSSRWYPCAQKSPYALHPVSQKFPQRHLWNGSNVCLICVSTAWFAFRLRGGQAGCRTLQRLQQNLLHFVQAGRNTDAASRHSATAGHVWKGRSVVLSVIPFRTEYNCWTCLER